MRMNRIVVHHTAGGLMPSAFDLKHYHRVIDGDGKVHAGTHAIAANAPGRVLTSGTYAAHTRGLNTGSIGVAIAAMANAEWRDPRACAAFPRAVQVDAMIADVASLCVDHSIAPDRRTVLSHAEVETTMGITQAGKWDFDYDPFGVQDTRDPVAIGDMLRARVVQAIKALGQQVPLAPRGDMPVLRRGAYGDFVGEAQRHLIRHGARITADRAFGPRTYAAVVAFQRRHQLMPDGIVGAMTWAALLAG